MRRTDTGLSTHLTSLTIKQRHFRTTTHRFGSNNLNPPLLWLTCASTWQDMTCNKSEDATTCLKVFYLSFQSLCYWSKLEQEDKIRRMALNKVETFITLLLTKVNVGNFDNCLLRSIILISRLFSTHCWDFIWFVSIQFLPNFQF